MQNFEMTQEQLTKVKQKYEIQSHNVTLILTHSMREINEVWAKSRNCNLFKFNSDGSKFKVNSKCTPQKNIITNQLNFKPRVQKKGKKKYQGKIDSKGKRIIYNKTKYKE